MSGSAALGREHVEKERKLRGALATR